MQKMCDFVQTAGRVVFVLCLPLTFSVCFQFLMLLLWPTCRVCLSEACLNDVAADYSPISMEIFVFLSAI